MERAFEDIARRWQAWWPGRRQRAVRAIGRCVSLVAMTTILAFLYGISKLVRGLPPLAWGCAAAAATVLILLALPEVDPGPVAPAAVPAVIAAAPAANPPPPPHHPATAPPPPAPVAVAAMAAESPGVSQPPHSVPRAEAEPGTPEHGAAHHPEAESEEGAAVAAQGLSVFATVGEAVLDQFGESLGFFEIGEKLNGVFIPLKNGDTTTAVSKGAGAATEYSLAVYLVDAFEIMALIGSGLMVETAAGIAGSMAIVRSSAVAGDKVEETTHHTLSPPP